MDVFQGSFEGSRNSYSLGNIKPSPMESESSGTVGASPVVDTPGAGGATNQPYSEGQGTAGGAAQGIQPSKQDAGTSGTGEQGKR